MSVSSVTGRSSPPLVEEDTQFKKFEKQCYLESLLKSVHFPNDPERERSLRCHLEAELQKVKESPTPSPPSPDSEMDKLTAKMQRLSCGGAFSKLQAAGTYVWNASVVEIPRVYFLKVLSSVSSICFSKPLFSQESLQTQKERIRAVEIVQMKAELPKECAALSECASEFAIAIMQQIVAEKLSGVPGLTENWLRYKMRINGPWASGYVAEYTLNQVDRRTGCMQAFSRSPLGKYLGRLYVLVTNRFSQSSIQVSTLNPSISFEHIALKACMKVLALENKMKLETANTSAFDLLKTPKRIAAVFESLAATLSLEVKIQDTFIRHKIGPQQTQEAFILRLACHKQNHTLPPGLPDPDTITPKNLQQEQERALYSYSQKLVEMFLDSHTPDSMWRGLFGVMYWLEGDRAAKDIGAAIVADALKLLVDPDGFIITVLTALGDETMNFEADKFGPGKERRLVRTAKAMLEKSLEPDCTSFSLHKIYENSKLSQGTKGASAVLQKQQSRERLKTVIQGMIYDAVKEEQSVKSAESVIRSMQARLRKIPVLGVATLVLQGVVESAIGSCQYFMQQDRSFSSFMTQKLVGDGLFSHIADRVVALIDHPTWSISVLHVVETLVKSVTVESVDMDFAERYTKKNFNTVASFLFNHFMEDQASSMTGAVAAFITGDKVFSTFLQFLLKPQDAGLMQKGVPVVQSTINEYHLYTRVTNYFRSIGVTFEGDAKFWECYIRIYLTQMAPGTVENDGRIRSTPACWKPRESVVEELLALNSKELRQKLANGPVLAPKTKMTDAVDTLVLDYATAPPPKQEEPKRVIMASVDTIVSDYPVATKPQLNQKKTEDPLIFEDYDPSKKESEKK